MESTTQQNITNIPNVQPQAQMPTKPGNPGFNKRIAIFVVASSMILMVISAVGYLFYINSFSKQSNSSIASNKQSPPVNAVNDGEIVYENLGQLYVFDTSTMEESLLQISDLESEPRFEHYPKNPHGLHFSTDARYLFFEFNRKFYIYDFTTKNYSALDIDPNPFSRPDEVSPDNKIIVVDTGTGPGESGKTFISLENKKIIFRTFAYSIVWSPDSKNSLLRRGKSIGTIYI